MTLASSLMHPLGQHHDDFMIITATVASTLLFVTLLNRLLHPRRPPILPSPLKTLLPTLASSPPPPSTSLYPPDYFPGARDVPTPYGSLRCYEFGPADGRRVVLVHGISTSCMTLAPLARGLVDGAGCRVLLFDLFGRGYSDAVGDLPYDERLYVAQALCALASSDLPWTGHQACDVVGYSLGGAIAVHLAAAFPRMIRSLVLLAPAGLIREQTFGAASRLVFRSSWVPEGLLEIITRWRLKRPIAASAKKRKQASSSSSSSSPPPSSSSSSSLSPSLLPQSPLLPGDKTIEATITSEIVDPATPDHPPPNELQRKVLAFVRWQTTHHAGFVTAFQSTVRHAPLMNQHEAFRKLAARKPKTVCFIFGDGDEIVNEEDYRQDALPLVGGEEHVVWEKSVRGAHDFPMVDPETTLRIITQFWERL